MHQWLEQASSDLAALVGEDAAAYALAEADIDDLLRLAGVAAHESGERTNAPLLCYLVGLARGRHPERGVAGLVADLASR